MREKRKSKRIHSQVSFNPVDGFVMTKAVTRAELI
jgi:hypothetical protein